MSANGIAEIGQTDQMFVVAEVPEDSINKVRLGQTATISSDNGAFSGQYRTKLPLSEFFLLSVVAKIKVFLMPFSQPFHLNTN